MIVLGIHMGHDAAVAVLSEGRILSLIERERRIRLKHAAIATIEDIDAALADAGMSIEDIDRVAVTTTQNWPFLFVEPDRFRFRYAPELLEALGGPMRGDPANRERWQDWSRRMRELEGRGRERLSNFKRFPDTAPLFGQGPGERAVDPDDPSAEVLFTQQFPFHPSGWTSTTADAEVVPAAARAFPDGAWRSLLIGIFHAPILATINGRRIAGAVIPHHLAHAATAYYGSDADSAAIVTHDGGHEATIFGHTGGLYCFGEGERLYPVWYNHAVGGNLYRRVADACGLPGMGGPGKLMGLSPYGEPRFHSAAWVGSASDLAQRFPTHEDRAVLALYEKAWPYLREALRSEAQAEPAARHGIPAASPLDRFAKDLAASIQATFEAQTLNLARRARELADRLGLRTDTLCLTGGCALNCPANSLVWREGPFGAVFVPPTCDDSGLAIGAAFYVAHSLFEEPRAPQGARDCGSAYLGRRIDDDELRRALHRADGLRIEPLPDPAARAAEEISEGRILGWFEGRSEIGPRALGHRSILADPRAADSWRRVNTVKEREQWRPLAPAVLVERALEWFDGMPPHSPHMLFTGTVVGDSLPAITHVDRSARVQTVDETVGGFRDVLQAFEARTGVPVLMNTSLNGRGEPIVETPEDALAMFRRSKLDALYVKGHRITRPASSTGSE